MLAKSSTERRIAPVADKFPAYPATWYLFCTSGDLQKRPLSKATLGRRLTAFRTQSGRVAVLDAHCSHQGADLGLGCVRGEAIQCPFHHWQYDGAGHCVHIPHEDSIPEFALQRSYPTVERHGFVFFFNGPKALFPLPFFLGERPEDFVAGTPFRFVADCPWYVLVGNGFDTQHFRTVHDRRMIGEEQVDSPEPFARRIQFEAEITGDSIPDRALRAFTGNRVKISITSWGGSFVVVTGTFRRFRSYILILPQPNNEGKLLTEVIVFMPRRTLSLLRPLSLWIRRRFTMAFMQNDIDQLPGIQYRPHTFTEGDRTLVEFMHWLVSLPQTSNKEDLS